MAPSATAAARVRLQGPDRHRAHARIIDAFGDAVLDSQFESSDAEVARMTRADPSLVVEPVPVDCDATSRYRGFVHIHKTHGTWLGRAADYLMPKTVKAAFDAGVDVNDTAAFGGRHLFERRAWLREPDLVRLALDAGANPSLHGLGLNVAPLLNVLRSFSDVLKDHGDHGLSDAAALEEAKKLHESACLLIDAGADVRYRPDRGDGPLQTLVGEWLPSRAWTQPMVRELLTRLTQSGADLEEETGVLAARPVVRALRMWNIEGACMLIELGANVDVEVVELTARRSLVDLARHCGGEAGVARLTEAMLNQRIDRARRDLATIDQALPHARRAARVL